MYILAHSFTHKKEAHVHTNMMMVKTCTVVEHKYDHAETACFVLSKQTNQQKEEKSLVHSLSISNSLRTRRSSGIS